MSDNWNPPPGRNPHGQEPGGEQPTGRPAPGTPHGDGQSPLWWTESAEKPQEYLQPGPPGPAPQGPPPGQPQTWQYPPIPIPQPPGPGRRRKPRSTSTGLLIGLVVLAVLVVGSGITFALRSGGDDATVPVSADTPTQAPSEAPSGTPSQPPTVDEIVTSSRLYSVGPLEATQCLEPKVIPATFAAANAYYNAVLPCMNRTWRLAMAKASLPYRVPKLVLYAGVLETACGTERGTRGFYCDKSETIYLPYVLGAAYYKRNPVSGRAWMLNTLAHEYGHHVQRLSGIYAASLARQQPRSPNMRLAESRRRELQASCLGSAYLGASGPYIPIRGPLLASWKVVVAKTGDEFSRPRVHDHGSKVNHNYWSVRGFNSKDPALCNTFVAKDEQTS